MPNAVQTRLASLDVSMIFSFQIAERLLAAVLDKFLCQQSN